eukprot:jgi/Galph1/4245/GphlegSOOS_G2892.1
MEAFVPENLQQGAIYLHNLRTDIENQSIPVKERLSKAEEVIVSLENVADTIQQIESPYSALILYEEARKYKTIYWKLMDAELSQVSTSDIENELKPGKLCEEETQTFQRLAGRLPVSVNNKSCHSGSSAIIKSVLEKSFLLHRQTGNNKTSPNEACRNITTKTNGDRSNRHMKIQVDLHNDREGKTTPTFHEQDAELKRDDIKPSSANTFQKASERLPSRRNSKPSNCSNGPTKQQFVRKKGFQIPRSANSVDDNTDNEMLQQGQNEHSDAQVPQVANVEPRLVELITNEVLEKSPGVEWNDIAGLEFAKSCVLEAVVWPLLRPDLFSGIRRPPKGLLLFGPPGRTGKTMIGRAIASRAGATFFNISASSLTSKWVGESEKMVRALFGVARFYQPAVIFIDEIDSLLTQRSESDQESSRRLKTEFLVQMDGAGSMEEERILVIGATNRPQELDEAARRRLIKRLYIPLPESMARKSLITRLIGSQKHSLTNEQFDNLMLKTQGYSGSDLRALCAEAAMGPLRELGQQLEHVTLDNVRPINYQDFLSALRLVRASVAESDLELYKTWNDQYGSFPMGGDLNIANISE